MGIRAWLPRFRSDDDDLQEEIRAHLAIAIDERVADGADPQSARYAALKEFGNVVLMAEDTRRVWTPPWLEAARDQLSDIRYAIRSLAKHPVFSLAVVGVLTVGIGLNAAVFTMLKGFVLSPLAGIDGSAGLAVIYGETQAGRPVRLSYPEYRYLRDHDRAFSGLFGSAVATANLGRGPAARQIWVELVTGNYFDALRVRAQAGRTLLPSDEVAPGRHPVVVISDGLWRRDFGADPTVVGRTVEINNQPLTVVGVTDPAFHGTIVSYDVEAFVPVMTAPQLGFTFGSRESTPAGILSDRRATVFYPQGYLRSGVTLANAAAEAEAHRVVLSQVRPLTDPLDRLRIVPFWRTPGSAPTFILPTLGVLCVTGLLVLAIACANLAGLVLVRGVSRRGEIAVRLALGATRRRIVRLLILENLVLALPGGLLGVVLAQHGLPVLVSYAEWLAAPQRVFFNIDVDGLVVGFTALVACGTVLVFGFVPALQSSRVDLVSVINEDASPRGASRSRLPAGLVVAQVAVTVLLLVGAGLAARSVDAARRADHGFDPRQVTAVAVDVRQNGYDEARGRRFVRELLEALRTDPGVECASVAVETPLTLLDARARQVTIEGYAAGRTEDLAFMSNTVGPDYFRTLRIGLAAGREFEERDDESAIPVVIVNTTLAERFWGSPANALGRRARVATGEWRTIIGVVSNVKYSRVDEAPRPYVYLPFLQSYRPAVIVHARGNVPMDRLLANVRSRLAALDPDLPVLYARPMTEAIRGALIFYDLTATMLFLFGLAGMVLAGMGTYGLVSYAVKRNTHEIGIRMALGASRVAIVRDFLARGLRLGLAGAALGFVGALAVGNLLHGVLFGVSATDVTSFARALAIVLGGVTAATLVPAWRAARTDPQRVLRHQ